MTGLWATCMLKGCRTHGMVSESSFDHRQPKLTIWTSKWTWLLLSSGVVLQRSHLQKFGWEVNSFVSNSMKCNALWIKLTYLVVVLYSLLFSSMSGCFEAFSAIFCKHFHVPLLREKQGNTLLAWSGHHLRRKIPLTRGSRRPGICREQIGLTVVSRPLNSPHWAHY